jgi:hypothetical protein
MIWRTAASADEWAHSERKHPILTLIDDLRTLGVHRDGARPFQGVLEGLTWQSATSRATDFVWVSKRPYALFLRLRDLRGCPPRSNVYSGMLRRTTNGLDNSDPR